MRIRSTSTRDVAWQREQSQNQRATAPVTGDITGTSVWRADF
jgi:hypothetical protein